jgi:hypothetical protein
VHTVSINVNIVESESKYILWFKCSKSLFHLPQDVLFGIVYAPPANSKYCIGDTFNEIENELLAFTYPLIISNSTITYKDIITSTQF